MWENDNRKRLIINILICVVIIAVVAGLGFFMLRVHKETQAHDEELAQMYVQQREEQSEARVESVNSIDVEYQKQMDTVARYVPGIVCWGDNTTAAVSGMLNYPYALQTYINTYLCDIYDFSSTIPNALDYTRLDWKKYKLNIPVENMATGKESTYTVLGRAGAIPYVLAEDLEVPENPEPIRIYFTSEGGQYVTPLTGGDLKFNNIVIDGIEGTLAREGEYYYNGYPSYTFTRATAGQAQTIPKGTRLQIASENLYKNYIHVVMIGMYGEYVSTDDLVNQIKTLLARQTQNSDRFIVLGPYSHDIFMSGNATMNNIDDAMMEAFGNRYISIRKYLIGDGYTDAGIGASGEDVYYINQEMVPPSFRVASHNEELNSLAHKLIGKLVYTRMDSLGYFDEIKDSLNLTETTKEIIKNNPGYFESIINNTLK
jgi:hypothetical protein